MKVENFFQYILLMVGIVVFFSLLLLLVRNHRQDKTVATIKNNIEINTNEELEEKEVSDYFDRSYFDNDNFYGGDPYSRYCDGNEGSFNSFTVCAPN